MDVFSNLMIAGECLLDKRRTLAFQEAINSTVQMGDVVLDVGTGTGIMAMFAAAAGAKKVYAVEISEDVSSFAGKNIESNGYKDLIDVITWDAAGMEFPHTVDVVIMELLDTGLVAEHQAKVMNHLHRIGVITPTTKLLPKEMVSTVQLVEYDFEFYGFNMPFVIQARNYGAMRSIKSVLSKQLPYSHINFSSPVDQHVDITLKEEAITSGTANAILLKSQVVLTNTIKLWGTSDMNMPVVIPLIPQKVKRGHEFQLSLGYDMGEGFSRFSSSLALS